MTRNASSELNLCYTKLWKSYIEKQPCDDHTADLKCIYKTSVDWLKAVRDTFPNYTLHDETHIINVMEGMAGILGDKTGNLSLCEHELLLLAAMLHDIGMVYTPKAKEQAIKSTKKLKSFLKKAAPEQIDKTYAELSETQQQNYLRSLHAFRVQEILESKEWAPFTEKIEHMVSIEELVSICQSHGEDEDFLISEIFNEDEYDEIDPRFCALLLRLADILDFDGSRAPEILFPFTNGKARSIEAFQKHLSSCGFKYATTPSDLPLSFKASCEDPDIEFKLRQYLDWVDKELLVAERTKARCTDRWRKFPFPRCVSRKEIRSKGYDSSDFCLTMDQDRTLALLTGQNLYENNAVFVRELLQNSIDATLLRAKLDPDFKVENAAIYMWEWTGNDGTIYFRIDDQGTGMTRGMIQRYFLKVGNSYYESDELIRDLQDRGCDNCFQGISRFGIGFLSCFLCGDKVEFSTLYYDEKKSRRDSDSVRNNHDGYGLNMKIPGLKGRYVLHNQSKHHKANPLPSYRADMPEGVPIFETNGYRSIPGMSIVVTIDPGKLGAISLKNVALKNLCAPRMAVYYNGQKLTRSYDEFMAWAHLLEQSNGQEYELKPDDKLFLDKTFPEASGRYPRLVEKFTALDHSDYSSLPGLSGLAVTYHLIYDDAPTWVCRDQEYKLEAWFLYDSIHVQPVNVMGGQNDWDDLMCFYPYDAVNALALAFEKHQSCPSVEDLGNLWSTFAEKENLHEVWCCFVNHKVTNREVDLSIPAVPGIQGVSKNPLLNTGTCTYQGVILGQLTANHKLFGNPIDDCIILLEDRLRPDVDLGRQKILNLPPEVVLYIELLIERLNAGFSCSPLYETVSLDYWRKLRNTNLGQWAKGIIGEDVNTWINNFSSLEAGKTALDFYKRSILQDCFDLVVCYKKGQLITATEKDKNMPDEIYAHLPPLLFCQASSEDDRIYLCDYMASFRHCITANHPFILWLRKNLSILNKRFPRQLDQIIYALRMYNGNRIILTINSIRSQFEKLHGEHLVDLSDFPILTDSDLWKDPDHFPDPN